MRILAVDDKKISLEALTDAIRKADPEAHVRAFLSADGALRFVKENTCDTAFIDIRMPGMDGIELAKRIKLVNPDVNIIFATGYDEYMESAFQLRASGYLLKPITPEAVRNELDNLRNPVADAKKNRIHIQCFGNFEVFVDDLPLRFRYDKSKEWLAYLVDRHTMCSNGAVMATLWDNDVSGSYFRTLRKDLFDTLGAKGCEDLIIRQRGMMGINSEIISCDYLDWIKGVPDALNAYHGEYMAQYSWAELTNAVLDEASSQ